jgi:hypothetical protein
VLIVARFLLTHSTVDRFRPVRFTPDSKDLSQAHTIMITRHLKRVFGYARPSDWAVAGGMASAAPISFWVMERVSPSHVGRGGFAPVMRLATAVGLLGGLHVLYQRSCREPHSPPARLPSFHE